MATSTATYIQAQPQPSLSTVHYGELQSTDPTCGGAKQAGVEVQLQKIPSPPTFANKNEEREYLKGRMTLAFRLFGKFGFDEGVAGHITLRDPIKTDHFWVNPLGTPFSLMRKSDLILVNKDGEAIDGGSNRLLNKAAYMIHHAIHVARPDVNCAAHSHSLYGRTFCTLGRPIDMLTQDSCAFYNDLAVYRQFKGAVLAKEEGENIASALSGKKACLLQNHGLLTVGPTVESAIFWFVSLEKCCQVQLMAEAAVGKPIPIDEQEADFTFRSVGGAGVGWFSAQPMFKVMETEIGISYLD